MQKYDTFAKTTYLVKLAMDPKIYTRKDGKGNDVVLTFVDNSRIEGTEQLWIDARVRPFIAERAAKYRKGDAMQVTGKLRFKKQEDGNWRGKIYDADIDSFVPLKDRAAEAGSGMADIKPDVPADMDFGTPAFE